MRPSVTWPEGKQFAFTIFDDADLDRFSNTKPVYDFLIERGFRTTKSCWLEPEEEAADAGATSCQNLDYLKWLMALQDQGFEIGWHQARPCESPREVTQRCLRLFKLYFGEDPVAMSNHGSLPENMYWGGDRFDTVIRWLHRLLKWRSEGQTRSEGQDQTSSFFWGDLCQRRIRYCRSFVFPDINTLKNCPEMPYRDEQRPYVNQWFAGSRGSTVETLNQTINEGEQDRLEREGGACILSTQFGNGFYVDGQMNHRFEALMQRLSEKNGWFVPVGTLLDFLAKQPNGGNVLSARDRYRLQWRWLKSTVFGP